MRIERPPDRPTAVPPECGMRRLKQSAFFIHGGEPPGMIHDHLA